MSKKSRNEDFGLHTDISDDVIAEALRSVEKHHRRKAEEAQLDIPLTLDSSEETQESIVLPVDLIEAITPEDIEKQLEELSHALEGAGEEPKAAREPDPAESQRHQIERLKGRVHELTREVERLETSLAEKTAEAQKNYERLLWVNAELENVRKRVAREKADMEKFGSEKLLREILPVVDNLERALRHAGESQELSILREGVQMTLTQFNSYLKRFGVTRIEISPGIPFDPAVHEAMMQEESSDLPANTVVREFLTGYLLQDRLLRASLVTVARPPSHSATVEIEEDDVPEVSADSEALEASAPESQEIVPEQQESTPLEPEAPEAALEPA